MAEEGVRNSSGRRLAAVMLTDIVGYTALSQKDEEQTLKLLRDHTATVSPLFGEHEGRVVKSTGDGFLIVFPSAVQATRCAIAVQKKLAENQHPLRIRIGIHIGDVIHQDGDVFGDGVNILSRIEPLAEPRGVCISQQVYDQVWNKVDAGFVSLGKKQLKNVERPLEIYRVDFLESLRRDEEAMASHTRIAVLPLVSISNDPADEYFADGLTEELIFTLSKLKGLRVIAQTSAMKYKGTKKAVSEIGQELRIGSILEGSVRKVSSRLRITLQLIDVSSEEHLWSEAYDRDLVDVLALQSDVAQCVGVALKKHLLPGAESRIEVAIADPEAYTLYLKGRVLLNKRTATSLREAIECLERVVELDATYAPAYASMAEAYSVFEEYDVCERREMNAKAKELAMKAVRLDARLPHAHAVLGGTYGQEFAWDDAEREYRLAISLDPSCVRAHHWLGYLLASRQQFAEAISELSKAVSLDPLSHTLHGALGEIHYMARQDDQALRELATSIELLPDNYMAYSLRGQLHLRAGKCREALADLVTAATLFGAPHEGVVLDISLAQARLGDTQALRRGLDELMTLEEEQPASPYILGRFHLLLDLPEEAFRLFAEALAERDLWMVHLQNHFESFHCEYQEDPRYLAIREGLGLT